MAMTCSQTADNELVPFFGGNGFSRGNDCAPATVGPNSAAITAIKLKCKTFHFLARILSPRTSSYLLPRAQGALN